MPATTHNVAAAGVLYLDNGYIFSLRAFLALSHSKLYLLAFIQRFKAGTVDVTKVYKNVRAAFLLNKTKTFFRFKQETLILSILSIRVN